MYSGGAAVEHNSAPVLVVVVFSAILLPIPLLFSIGTVFRNLSSPRTYGFFPRLLAASKSRRPRGSLPYNRDDAAAGGAAVILLGIALVGLAPPAAAVALTFGTVILGSTGRPGNLDGHG